MTILSRPMKKGVDYFPHACTHGQTMFILEQRWGNDGYAFWFKLLELLGSTEGHFLDTENAATREFLAAKTHLSVEQCYEILNLLADLDAIDQELWEKHHIIWCQNFVDHLEPVYRKRKTEPPSKPSFCDENSSIDDVSVTESTQSKVNKIKVNKIKVNKIKEKVKERELNTHTANASVGLCVCDEPSNGVTEEQEEQTEVPPQKHKGQIMSKTQLERFNQFWYEYPKKKAKVAAMKAWAKLKPDDVLFDAIMLGLRRARASIEWKREGGRFIPHPATFLNQGRWEDEYLPFEQKPTRQDLRNMSTEEYLQTVLGNITIQENKTFDMWGDVNEEG